MNTSKNITVYCGSSASLPESLLESAREVGREIAAAGATMVYGAGRTGLMGAAADAALGAGAAVTGVIPEFMVERGWHHQGLTRIEVTDTMHTRKARMLELAAGVIALTGGIGTFEEITEAMTWRQLGLYSGNVVILNAEGYYDPLIGQLRKAVELGFMKPDHLAAVKIATTPRQAVEMALAPAPELTFTPKF